MMRMTFFFNDTATTEIYTLSLHDALPIWSSALRSLPRPSTSTFASSRRPQRKMPRKLRSEEHTSELQSRLHLVCRLLLEKKKHHEAAASRHDDEGDWGLASAKVHDTHTPR